MTSLLEGFQAPGEAFLWIIFAFLDPVPYAQT
jgi:hypothetical protein